MVGIAEGGGEVDPLFGVWEGKADQNRVSKP